MTSKSFDVCLIQEFSGTATDMSIVEWIGNWVGLHSLHYEQDQAFPTITTVVVLLLYTGSSVRSRNWMWSKLNGALVTTYTTDTFNAYNQFMTQQLHSDEMVDKFLTELHWFSLAGWGTRGPYELGDTVWVKPPNSRCTTSFRRGWITGIISEQAMLVNGTPHHVRDVRPTLNTNPLASSGSGESSNNELWIWPMPREPDGPTANPDADADSSDATSESSDEEVQTIPLRRSARNKRPCPPCHMCDLETRGGVWTWKWD